MRVYYDLHIHSCLSPCGDDDMTPYNLVQMAALNELDIIALTDHNTVKNCKAAMTVGESVGLPVIPGMELTTSEEVHVVCLFPSVEAATSFGDYIYEALMDVENAPEVFGNQYIMSEADQIEGEIKKLLINATTISVSDVNGLVRSYGGACFPAHIDKDSNSILASLGTIPPECGFHAVEITKRGNVDQLKSDYPIIQDMPLLLDSDAHMLEQMHEKSAWLDLPSASVQNVIDVINHGGVAWGRE